MRDRTYEKARRRKAYDAAEADRQWEAARTLIAFEAYMAAELRRWTIQTTTDGRRQAAEVIDLDNLAE